MNINKKPLRLRIVDEIKEPDKIDEVKEIIKKPLKLVIVSEDIKIIHPTDHMCYILKSLTSKRIYVGYTIDFTRRLRQHNGEIVGGAKKTEKGRPWIPICHIKGFYDKSSALRFEWRIQHSKKPRPNCITNLEIILKNLLDKGDGVLPWPELNIEWMQL